jgi:hypothetical protein
VKQSHIENHVGTEAPHGRIAVHGKPLDSGSEFSSTPQFFITGAKLVIPNAADVSQSSIFNLQSFQDRYCAISFRILPR